MCQPSHGSCGTQSVVHPRHSQHVSNAGDTSTLIGHLHSISVTNSHHTYT